MPRSPDNPFPGQPLVSTVWIPLPAFRTKGRIKRLVGMNSIVSLSVLAFLLVASASPCNAMMSFTTVSKAKAKAMGMEVRITGNGPNHAWVELEFKTDGELKSYNPDRSSRVELQINDGDKLSVGYAALQERHPSPGRVVVSFLANRNYLNKIGLMVVVGSGAMAGGGYLVQVKDFIAPGNPD